MSRLTLNRKLVLEAAQKVADGAGGYDESWVAVGTVWANIAARSGREAGGEAVSLSRTGYRITVRAAPHGAVSRPQAGQRFRDGTRIFRIDAVAERDGALRYLTCFAEEELAL